MQTKDKGTEGRTVPHVPAAIYLTKKRIHKQGTLGDHEKVRAQGRQGPGRRSSLRAECGLGPPTGAL